MVLDYYPIKDWNDNKIVDKFLRILSFRGETMTKRIVSSQDLENEVVDRCDNYGYKVTHFNTQRQYVSNTND